MTHDSFLLDAFFEYPEPVVAWAHSRFDQLPDDLAPTHFADSEHMVRKPTHSIANERCFSEFLRLHGGSGFYHGRRCSYDVTPYDNRPSEITLWGDAEDERFPRLGERLLELWEPLGMIYAFAGTWDEYRARNGYELQRPGGRSRSGFYGRDFRRYVPGLFWLNYFSDQYASQQSIDLEGIVADLGGRLFRLAHGWGLRLYDQPTDWSHRSEEVQRRIRNTPGFFQKPPLELPLGLSPREELDWVHENIGLRWP